MPSLRDRLRAFLSPDLAKAGPVPSYTADLTSTARNLQMGQATSSSAEGNPNVQFGPSAAPPAQPLGGDPRQWQYRPAWNAPSLPGEGRPVSYDTLRSVAGVDWALRKALDVRKNEICSLTFSVMGRSRDKRKAKQIMAARTSKIQEIENFFRRPDGVHSFQSWLRMLLEDWLVLDGATIYRRRNLNPDRGPLGPGGNLGQLVSLDLIDGATIKPLLDDSGRRPQPPLPAYQQFLFGVPRASFTTQELFYGAQNQVVNTPYGRSIVETFLYLVSVHLRYWTNQGARWTDGTLPQGVAEAPPNWSPAQIESYQVFWDSVLAGDPKALRKLIFVPNGFNWHEFRGDDFDEKLARFLLDCICVACDVTPIEMGFEPSHGGLGGKGLGETLERVQERRSLRPTLRWLFEDILNPILWDEFDAPDLEWTALELDQKSERERAEALELNIRNGLVSVDEAIEEMGGEPVGIGRVFVVGPTQILFEPDLVQASDGGAASIGLLTTPEQQMQMAEQQHQHAMEALQAKPAGGATARPPAGPPSSSQKPDEGSDEGSGKSAAYKASDTTHAQVGLAEELRRWETKALKAVRSGRGAAVRFASDEIPEEIAEEIRAALTSARTPEAVKAAFAEPAIRRVVLQRLEDLVQSELTGRAA